MIHILAAEKSLGVEPWLFWALYLLQIIVGKQSSLKIWHFTQKCHKWRSCSSCSSCSICSSSSVCGHPYSRCCKTITKIACREKTLAESFSLLLMISQWFLLKRRRRRRRKRLVPRSNLSLCFPFLKISLFFFDVLQSTENLGHTIWGLCRPNPISSSTPPGFSWG